LQAAHLRGVASRHDHGSARAAGTHGAAVDHVVAVGERTILVEERRGVLQDRHALSGEGRFVDREIFGLKDSRVGRDPGTSFEEDNVAGHDLAGRDRDRLSSADDHGHRWSEPRERRDRAGRPSLRPHANPGVQCHDADDDHRVGEAPRDDGEDRGSNQQEHRKRTDLLANQFPDRALLHRLDGIRSVVDQTAADLVRGQPGGGRRHFIEDHNGVAHVPRRRRDVATMLRRCLIEVGFLCHHFDGR
jgi:hypothetical protein